MTASGVSMGVMSRTVATYLFELAALIALAACLILAALPAILQAAHAS